MVNMQTKTINSARNVTTLAQNAMGHLFLIVVLALADTYYLQRIVLINALTENTNKELTV